MLVTQRHLSGSDSGRSCAEGGRTSISAGGGVLALLQSWCMSAEKLLQAMTDDDMLGECCAWTYVTDVCWLGMGRTHHDEDGLSGQLAGASQVGQVQHLPPALQQQTPQARLRDVLSKPAQPRHDEQKDGRVRGSREGRAPPSPHVDHCTTHSCFSFWHVYGRLEQQRRQQALGVSRSGSCKEFCQVARLACSNSSTSASCATESSRHNVAHSLPHQFLLRVVEVACHPTRALLNTSSREVEPLSGISRACDEVALEQTLPARKIAMQHLAQLARMQSMSSMLHCCWCVKYWCRYRCDRPETAAGQVGLPCSQL